MDESISVSSITDKLPPSWKNFKHTLKHGKDDLSLVQLGSHLRIEESLRALDNDKGKGKEVGGPFVNMTEEGKNKHNKQNKGKKRSNENNSGSSSNKKPKLECWKCGKTGHFKRDCRSGKKNNANAGGSGKGSKDHSQDQDSGATTHVCKHRCWFKTFKPVEDGSILYIGDEHFAPVHGKRSVALDISSGKTATLFNVLYVPKLHKNLVSGPVLNKCEYKLVYKSDKYILSKSGVFVGFGYYNNGIIYETTASYTPQQNGVAERKNRALKEMVNSMLSYSGLSEGFWGEAMLTACYLLNMVPNKRNKTTPYELWYKKRPNLAFLRVWGCRAVVRLPDPKRKTLGEKESRDAIFDENRFSLIPRPKDIIPNLYLVEGSRDQVGSQYFYCFSIKEDPRTYNEAMQSRDAAFWKEATDDEIGFIMENNTWVLSDLPPGCKPLEKLKPNIGKPVDQLEYSRAIGCLMFAMTSTRPDITYVVGRLMDGCSFLGKVPFHELPRSKHASLVLLWKSEFVPLAAAEVGSFALLLEMINKSRSEHVVPSRPVWGCGRLVSMSQGFRDQVMAILVILVSSDSSEDSVGTPAGRVILFGSDPSEDPSSDHIPPLPATSPFLSLTNDATDSDTPDTPPSPTHAPGQPIPHGRPYRYHLNEPVHMMTARKRVGPLPVQQLTVRHYVDHSLSDYFSPDDSAPDSSSDSSSEASSDFHSDASSDSSSRHSLSDHSSPDLPSNSARPSHKRRMSLMTSVPALPPVSGDLSPVRADLIPSPKRIRDSGYLEDVEVDPRETSLRDDVIIRGSDEPHLEVVVEAVDREESETGARGPVEVRVERVTDPVMPDDIPEPAQEGAVEVIKGVQREQGHRIVRVESTVTAWTKRITELERDNRRLKDTASVESQRVDRLQHGMSRM
ncbi:zinc finger, CCHC-type containing protein [Tanacetum coccineum]